MLRIVIFFFLITLTFQSIASINCSNALKARLLELRTNEFVIASDKKRNEMAIEMLNCIGASESNIRDDIVYGGLSKWLRADKLTPATTLKLFESLVNILAIEDTDKNNFTRPFAALIFSEVLRVDRISPYLTSEQRVLAVNVSTDYMKAITDYRGFNDIEGWRHSVAHTSDIFLQLALNKNMKKNTANAIVSCYKNTDFTCSS